MKDSWWRGLLEDPRTNLASHTKALAILGSIISSWIMIYETIHNRMNSDYLWAYLGILVAGAAASKWIGLLKDNNNKNATISTYPSEK